MASGSDNPGLQGHVRDLEKGLPHVRTRVTAISESPIWPPPSSPTVVVSTRGKALMLSTSGKGLDGNSPATTGRKKYVRQVTGRHNDTELHLAARSGDVASVRLIVAEIEAQTAETFAGEVAEIQWAIVNEVNELGETALFSAAEKGHLDVVKELLKFSTEEGVSAKNRSGFDPLHIAASQGHQAIVQVLLEHDPALSKTIGQSRSTPLVSAAAKGHAGVVAALLEKDSGLVEIARANGKNALHLASRQGHVDIVRMLLEKDPQLARRTDKKGQTALHMAVKGVSCEAVRLLVDADSAILMLPDKFGNTALHVAIRKRRTEIVNELLSLPDTNVNALTRDQRTPLDIAESLSPSEETQEIRDNLTRHGASKAKDLNQPRDELRKTVTQIKKDVHSQLKQTRQTNRNVTDIAKELRRLHREGINNATNSVTIVAVLFTTVALTAIFTVPGGDDDQGRAVVASSPAFAVFFLANAVALFTSMAVVVVQITVVRGETKAERQVIEVINKLMWLASVCTSVAFIAASYIVVGRRNLWAAVFVTVVGGVVMVGVLGTMTYYVVKSKRVRRVRKISKVSRSENHHESDSEVNPNIYAI